MDWTPPPPRSVAALDIWDIGWGRTLGLQGYVEHRADNKNVSLAPRVDSKFSRRLAFGLAAEKTDLCLSSVGGWSPVEFG